MTCKYLEDAVPFPGDSLDDLPCVIHDGPVAAAKRDDGDLECMGCARTPEQLAGDWPDEASLDSARDVPSQLRATVEMPIVSGAAPRAEGEFNYFRAEREGRA